jgi:2',3'-cyclic-nucleotide 2'-phosphodiesterase (5'-nucleotidase family)
LRSVALNRALRLSASLLSPLLLLSAASAQAERRVVIFHTSDIHGYAQPHSVPWSERPGRLIGGFEALGAHLDAEPSPYLLLDSGDFFQGAPEGTLSRGSAIVELMNASGYDAVAVGNHEYDFGEANLRALARLARFPLLAANIQITESGAPVDYARPWALFERGGVRVGVVGLATRFTSTATLPAHVAHLRFVEEVKAARPHVEALRAAGAEVVVALTHCGVGPGVSRKRVDVASYTPSEEDLHYPGDIEIAREAGVDLVLGGHAHAAFSELWAPEGGALIAQSGEQLEHVSRVVVRLPDEGGRPVIEGRLVPLWLDALPPPARPQVEGAGAGVAAAQGLRERLKGEVARLSSQTSAQMGVVIGEASEPLPRFVEPPHLDGPLPNLFCDAMARVAGADLALHNTFGFRSDLPQGPLTVGHLYQVMPFDNQLAVMTLTGAQIKALLEANIEGGASRIQVSHHLSFEVSLSPTGGITGSRLSFEGAPIDEARAFKVAMNSYMAGGGSCCKAIASLPSTDTAIPLRVLFMDEVRAQSPLRAPSTGRIRRVGAVAPAPETPPSPPPPPP